MRATRVVLDGIIFALQQQGGVSTYFRELASRVLLLREDSELWTYGERGPAGDRISRRQQRLLERYRQPAGVSPEAIVHSSYYRTSAKARANVVTVYDFIYERLAHESLGRGRFTHPIGHFVHSRQKRQAIERADAVICISEATKQDLLEYCPRTPESKIHVVHLAAGSQFFRLAGSADRSGDDNPYVLVVGSRASNKNFGAAVAAVASAPGLKLVCVGGGDFTADERNMLSRALPGRFTHAGYVDGTRLNELYNGAVALIYTSQYEGFGIPILEAMAAGCPVITTRAGSMLEVAGDAAVLLDRPEPDAIAQSVADIRSGDTRASLIARGRQRAAMFSWDATAARTMEIYSALIS